MGKRIDLTGQRFGRLVVVSYNEEVSKQKKGSCWNCKCDCGNEKVVYSGNLKGGRTTSCGCLQKVGDLIGQRFGRLTVISYNEEVGKQKGRVYYNCKCDCGNEVVARGDYLRGSNTVSCGCYRKEKMREMVKEKWQNEEFRRTKSEVSSKWLKEKWQNEEFRRTKSEVSSKTLKGQWQDEEFRQMQSNRMKETLKGQWQDEEFRQMQSIRMSKRMSGDNHPNWQGGITPISMHLRSLNEQWFNDCKKQANYTCELTGKVGGNLHTHHLKAFSTIVKEAHELHNIQVKPQVKDYTKEELHKLEEYVASWHKDNSNAVVLSEEVHKLFHSLYGQGDNTPEQFEEFRKRYIAGEFKDLI